MRMPMCVNVYIVIISVR